MNLPSILAALAIAVCAACASATTAPAGPPPDLTSTRISHDVYFALNDPSDGNCDALVAACGRLREIPGVVHVTVGRRDVSQVRDVNRTDYHVGLHVEFTGQAAYEAYDPHPVHQALLAEFGPTFAGVWVHDTLVGG